MLPIMSRQIVLVAAKWKRNVTRNERSQVCPTKRLCTQAIVANVSQARTNQQLCLILLVLRATIRPVKVSKQLRASTGFPTCRLPFSNFAGKAMIFVKISGLHAPASHGPFYEYQFGLYRHAAARTAPLSPCFQL